MVAMSTPLPVRGRYAPSPTSDLHIGNLRTAIAAWLCARSAGGGFSMRIEDLDELRVRAASGASERQLCDLAELGLDWDPPVVWQSQRADAYAEALAALGERVYSCFCTRREIAEAASAPHGDGFRPYPGTCRALSSGQRAERARTRTPAWRVRADGEEFTVFDAHAGEVSGVVDDFVCVRNDGVPAYNFAVVVDDIAAGVTQVCRGDDLLSSAPRQAWLATQLGATAPTYAHVSLVVNAEGKRLAKRDGDVTLADLRRQGVGPEQVTRGLLRSLGQRATTLADAVQSFELAPAMWAPVTFTRQLFAA